MTAQYKNPWHKQRDIYSGPEIFTTEAKPKEYKGYLIYHVKKDQYDVVKDGVCVSQLAGPNGAIRKIDQLTEED